MFDVLSRAPARVAPIALVAPATVAILALIVVWACRFGSFDYDGSQLDSCFSIITEFYLGGTVVRLTHLRSRVGESVQAFCMFLAMSILTLGVSAVLARGQVAYIDDTLAAIDRALFRGFDWSATNAALSAHPQAMTLLSYAYVSLNWQPFLLFLAACFRWSNADSKGVVASWALAILACVLPFHWLPAQGAYIHYGILPAAVPGRLVTLPWEYPATLEAVRSGMLHTFGRDVFVGLITIPSFHACAAVLLGWGFSKVPLLRWPMGLLNVLMFVSAMPIGGHYLIDLVAGLLVAVGSIGLVGRLAAMPPPFRKIPVSRLLALQPLAHRRSSGRVPELNRESRSR